MKKVFFLLLLAFPHALFGQTPCSLFEKNPQPALWLGIDYSHLYLPPSFTKALEDEHIHQDTLNSYLFSFLNNLVCREYKKYDPGAMLHRKAYLDTAAINEINASIEIDQLFEKPEDTLTQDDLTAIIANYTFNKPTGFAIALIAERFEIRKKRAIYHVVVIDVATRQLVVTEKLLIPFELTNIRRSMWTTLFLAMRSVEEDHYPTWKKKLCPKTR